MYIRINRIGLKDSQRIKNEVENGNVRYDFCVNTQQPQ